MSRMARSTGVSASWCSTVSFGLPRARDSICSIARSRSPVGAVESSAISRRTRSSEVTPRAIELAGRCLPPPTVTLEIGPRIDSDGTISVRQQSDHAVRGRTGDGVELTAESQSRIGRPASRSFKRFLWLPRPERLPPVAPPLFHNCSTPIGRKRGRSKWLARF
jgi:hypothetical protein